MTKDRAGKWIGWAAALCLGAGPALADDPQPVVVELFSSQGCSACPPADALIGDLAGRDDVIALALHVDYWDYIGWADTFAQPAFTARQHGYAAAAGSNMVYTPHIVVAGADHVAGTRAMVVADLIDRHRRQVDPVRVSVTAIEDGFRVEAEWRASDPSPAMVVHLVAYAPRAQVDITRGENAGQAFEYANIVRDWQVLAEWDGQSPFSTRLEGEGDLPRVIIVQRSEHGAILGAARLEDPRR